MRWLGVVVVLLGGCAMRFHPDARTGRDGTPRGARQLGWQAIEGILTARGGDRTDWLAFDVPAVACGSSQVQVVLDWKPARPGQRVKMTVRDHELQVVEGRRGPRTAFLEVREPGRFYVELTAPGRDDAGAYSVQVRRDDQTICPPPPQVASVPPPVTPPPATSSIAVALGVAVPPPPVAVNPWRSSWHPRQAVPLAARAIQLIQQGGDVIVVFNRGSAAGIAVGWTGVLLDGAGRPTRHKLVIHKVTGQLAFAKVTGARVKALVRLRDAQLTP